MSHDNKKIQSLVKLRDLLLMLDPSSSVEAKKKISSLLSLLKKSSRRHSDYYHCQRPWSLSFGMRDVIPRFVKILRDCVLTHQWDKALKIVEVLSREMKSSDATVWKVGTACLLQMGEAKSRLLRQFVKQVSALRSIAVVEVFVEFLLHLLTQGNLLEAKDLGLELKKSTQYNVILDDPKRQAAQTLFDAYQGLIVYAQWKKAISLQDQDHVQLSQDPSQSSQASISVAEPRLLADAAIHSLSTIKDKPGVWDIFLSRVVEMQVFYGSVEDARNLLMEYASKNPDNPNSHRYLYELETSTSNRPEIREKHLKDLIKLDPCNPLCIDLYKLVGDKQPGSVSLLFDHLDYDHCSNDLTVLNLLVLRLEKDISNERLEKEVRHCWESRSSWWPATVLRDACTKRKLSLQDSQMDRANDKLLIVNTKRKIYTILRNL